MREVLEAVLRAQSEGRASVMLTVVATQGSAPQRPGARMVVLDDGSTVGTIGGGCLEADMCRRAREALVSGRSVLAAFDLTPDQAGEDGLVCGGRMQVFVEAVDPVPTLCLFGAGHVALPLARQAKQVGFRVEVVDDRVAFANAERFPDADRIVVDEFGPGASRMTLGPNSYVVVVTRGHKGDADALAAVLGRELRYVGLLGSKVKAVHIMEQLAARGFDSGALSRIHTPVGLSIGAVTPEEIAVSIVAEMVAVRRGVDPRSTASLRMDLPGRLGSLSGRS